MIGLKNSRHFIHPISLTKKKLKKTRSHTFTRSLRQLHHDVLTVFRLVVQWIVCSSFVIGQSSHFGHCFTTLNRKTTLAWCFTREKEERIIFLGKHAYPFGKIYFE